MTKETGGPRARLRPALRSPDRRRPGATPARRRAARTRRPTTSRKRRAMSSRAGSPSASTARARCRTRRAGAHPDAALPTARPCPTCVRHGRADRQGSTSGRKLSSGRPGSSPGRARARTSASSSRSRRCSAMASSPAIARRAASWRASTSRKTAAPGAARRRTCVLLCGLGLRPSRRETRFRPLQLRLDPLDFLGHLIAPCVTHAPRCGARSIYARRDGLPNQRRHTNRDGGSAGPRGQRRAQLCVSNVGPRAGSDRRTRAAFPCA